MIVADTSLIYALLDANDTNHPDAVEWYGLVDEELATTPLVLAEVDHLARHRAGEQALHAFRRDVTAGAYAIEWWRDAATDAVEVAEQYRDLRLSLADGSLVALAARLETTAVATFDERDFRAMRPLRGAPAFTILPADAERG